MDHASPSAQLTFGEHTLDLQSVPAVEGNEGIAIGPMRTTTGAVTYDPGFMNTANAKSSITYIDGDAGVLRYRGYPIEQLDRVAAVAQDRKSTRLNSSHVTISYDVFCSKKKKHTNSYNRFLSHTTNI